MLRLKSIVIGYGVTIDPLKPEKGLGSCVYLIGEVVF